MIVNTKQKWRIGDKVNIGFLKNLNIIDFLKIKDCLPDIYILEKNEKLYKFIPHNGLTQINRDEYILIKKEVKNWKSILHWKPQTLFTVTAELYM